MATKEQERNALSQIIQIVNGLGNDSYIAIAFEGCFDMARDNIQNDYACSMKKERDMVCEQLNEAEDTIQCRENELADKEKEIHDLRKTVETLTSEKLELHERLHEAEETGSKIIDERSALSVKCAQQEDEILHLKARLYDFMTGKEF